MGIQIDKKSYAKLISEDIDRLEIEMQQSPERDHIKAVLEWSIGAIYDKKEFKTSNCPICSSEMKGFELTHYHCKKCNEYFTN